MITGAIGLLHIALIVIAEFCLGWPTPPVLLSSFLSVTVTSLPLCDSGHRL